MFEQTISIELVDRAPVTLKLSETGVDPKFTMLAVTDVATEQTIWWIVAAPEDAVWYEVPPEDVSGGKVVPIEEADPETVHWIREKMEEELETAIPVGTITFGVVPKGFHQIEPPTGTPQSLQTGRAYAVMVSGLSTGHLEFTL